MAQNDVIVISDDEGDFVNKKISEETQIIVIDEDDDIVELTETTSNVIETIASSQVKSESCRPLKNLKFSENGVKRLQAQVKLIDIGKSKKPLKLKVVKPENDEVVATSSTEFKETNSSVQQVRIEMERFPFFRYLF